MVITGLTRNQLYLTVPWVRIPPLPPKTRKHGLLDRAFGFSSAFLDFSHKHEKSKIRAWLSCLEERFFTNLFCHNSTARISPLVSARGYFCARKPTLRKIFPHTLPVKRAKFSPKISFWLCASCPLNRKNFAPTFKAGAFFISPKCRELPLGKRMTKSALSRSRLRRCPQAPPATARAYPK